MTIGDAITRRLARLPTRVALVALFPRAAVFTYAPGFFRARGVLVYVVACTAFIFATLSWVIPAAERLVETNERERDDLRSALGREPTDGEFYARLVAARRERRGRR